MPEAVLYPEWRKQNESTRYPFSDNASLINSENRVLVEGTFLDAALYPIGGGVGLYLSKVVVEHEHVTLTIGDATRKELATGSFSLFSADDSVALEDAYGRPAGILVSESSRLGIFQAWGVGTHTFLRPQTEFAATVCFPTPEVGVRGIVLEDGSLFVGDVWLVGSDGVVFRSDEAITQENCGAPTTSISALRFDVVGDPLFRRQLCQPNSLFNTPRFVKTLRIIAGNRTIDLIPDDRGEMQIVGNNYLADDTVLRISVLPTGLRVGAVGSSNA